jgi:hypothetical protein
MRSRAFLMFVLVCMVIVGSYSAAFAWTITAYAGPQGSISPSGEVTVADGASQTFTITPHAGCFLNTFLVDGAHATPVSTYTFENVTANHTITAYFVVDRICYSSLDTCYVCYDSTENPWRIMDLDLGACDTVRIGCPICIDFSNYAVGDSFAVPVYIFSDSPIEAFSLGFRHDGRSLQFGGTEDGWDPAGGVLSGSQRSGIQ